MGGKKKKSPKKAVPPSQPSQDGLSAVPGNRAKEDDVVVVVSSVDVDVDVDYVTVRLKRKQGEDKRFPSRRNVPTLTLHPKDLSSLGLRPGERAMVIVMGSIGREVAVVRVRADRTPSSLRPGQATLTPVALESRLVAGNTTTTLATTTSTSTPSKGGCTTFTSQTPTPTPSKVPTTLTSTSTPKLTSASASASFTPQPAAPSPSGSTFSFASGGGGDLLVTPSPPTKSKHTSHSHSKSQSKSNSPVVVVASLQRTGWARRLLHDKSASFLTLAWNDNNDNNNDHDNDHGNGRKPAKVSQRMNLLSTLHATTTMSFRGSVELLRKVAVASLHDTYVKKGDIVSIPRNGLFHDFTVVDIHVHENKNKNNNDMSQTATTKEESVANADNSNSNATATATATATESATNSVSQIVESLKTHSRPFLYRVNFDTEIRFLNLPGVKDGDNEEEEEEKDEMGNAPFQLCPKQELDRVGGLSDVKSSLQELLGLPLFQPWQFRDRNFRPPRGVLLFGPSGVGKTLVAKEVGVELAEQAETLGIELTVKYVPSLSLLSSSAVVGENERNLWKLFQRPNHKKGRQRPNQHQHQHTATSTLLVLDDLQALCPPRGNIQSSQTSDSLTSTMLAVLDGIDSVIDNHNNDDDDDDGGHIVVVLGIARSPSDLDPALRRPGRLDEEVEIPIPDDHARADIWKVQLQTYEKQRRQQQPEQQQQQHSHQEQPITLTTDTNCMALARAAKGFTGADTMMAIKEAHKNSRRKQQQQQQPEQKMLPMPILTLEALFAAIKTITPSALRTSAQALVELPCVQWTDIGGMHEVKRTLREAVGVHTHDQVTAQLYRRLGIRPPRGVLLYGPPGGGKTMLARAIATEAKRNFLAVKGPELLSKWLGESERSVAALFQRARRAKPCVIFFDEIDAVACSRSRAHQSSGSFTDGRLLSQILTEIDGIHTDDDGIDIDIAIDNHTSTENRRAIGVVVVGATNRPDLLDPALTRPGRMDQKIYVGVPDADGRESILSIKLQHGTQCLPEVNISELAKEEITGGFSGAELVAICREAALLAMEEGANLIAKRHLLQAIDSTAKQITPEMLQFYADFQKRGS